jgi:hypothetical protein
VILSPADLMLLTGRMRYTAQRRVLDALGVPYRVRPDGSVVVFQEDLRRESTTQKGPASPRLRFSTARGSLVRQAG